MEERAARALSGDRVVPLADVDDFLNRALAGAAGEGERADPSWAAQGSATSALEQSSARATELKQAIQDKATTIPFLSECDRMNMAFLER